MKQFKQQINPFFPTHTQNEHVSRVQYVVVHDDKLLLNGEHKTWTEEQLDPSIDMAETLVLGYWEDREYRLIDVSKQLNLKNIDENSLMGLRHIALNLEDHEYAICASALQLKHWMDKHQYCGCCGSKLNMREDERAMECLDCGNREYPKVHPCVIVRVIKDDKILLCRSHHFPEGLYSHVAGFIEPGESAEKAVYREVIEETGVTVKNIQYLGSQSWPFPSQIMLAFCAEYESGDIQVDGVEVEDAKWWTLEELPDRPKHFSISSWLFEEFLQSENKN